MYVTKNVLWNKGVCDQYGVCRYSDAPPYFQSEINHKQFGIHVQSEIKKNKIKLIRTKIYHGRDIINLADEFCLCNDGMFLSNKYKLLEIGRLIGVEAQTCN